ncbi:MAG: prephenate dehydrogenase/arogenate dehydrogenase family protein [Candidatus Limnocylindrales bacterium]
MRIALLGLGLIGGSVAQALRVRRQLDWSADTIVAWTPTGRGPASALREGTIDVAARTPEVALDGAGLVVLAGPVPACLALLDDLAGPWRSALTADSVVTDVASTKGAMVLRATALGVRFVGGHPMAGRETSGYAAATPDLFVDRPWVVVPTADDAAVARVEDLAVRVGARPVRMSAGAHDRAVAGISHLPLVTAAALVEAIAGSPGDHRDGWPEARLLAATGWRDMTRLARGDVAMGSGIATTNAAPLAARIRDLITTLGGWADELERDGGPDPDAMHDRLSQARAVLELEDA